MTLHEAFTAALEARGLTPKTFGPVIQADPVALGRMKYGASIRSDVLERLAKELRLSFHPDTGWDLEKENT